MAQVTARIVVAQASNPAPGGYSYGGRDDIELGGLVTLTNQDNTGATSHVWEVFPAVGLTEGSYGVAGKESATCTLTPPASTGYGDVAVRLTVRGDPLPGGRPNIATHEVLLGVRAPLDGYEAGLPIVHPHESLPGGKVTLDVQRGSIGRIAEAIRALKVALAESSGGNAVVYQQGGTASPGVYTTFAAALAAAQEIAGPVTIYIDPSVDPPAIPAGTHDLDQRIRLVAYLTDTPGSPCALTLDSGAVLQDACYFENLSFDGLLVTPLLTASAGQSLDVTFVRCKHIDAGNDDPFVALPSGSNRFVFLGGSHFSLGYAGESFAILASGKNVECVVDGFSYLNESCFEGGAGTLTLSVNVDSVVKAQSTFAGTLVRRDGAARLFRAQGVSGSVSLDTTTWTTVGTVRIDPSLLPSLNNGALAYALHADLEVIEASAGTVQAQVRLLDASLTSLGSVSSTLSGATTFPEHKSASLTAGGSNGQVRPTATTYLVQLRRSGGSSGDRVLCHNAYLEASWS